MAKTLPLGRAENSKLMGQWQHKNLRYSNRHARRRYNRRKAKGNLASQRYNKAFFNATLNAKPKAIDSMKAYLEKEGYNV